VSEDQPKQFPDEAEAGEREAPAGPAEAPVDPPGAGDDNEVADERVRVVKEP
jgi:hypothetical protein